MIELLTSPEAWAALLTLTALEIVLGIDNILIAPLMCQPCASIREVYGNPYHPYKNKR